MKIKFIYGIMLALAFLMSGASWASPYTNNSSYESPGFDTFKTVWPPAVPAVAMAPGDSDSETADKNCMAGCHIDERSQILASWRTDSWAMYANFKVTDNRKQRAVLACGYSDIPRDKPYKVPIAV